MREVIDSGATARERARFPHALPALFFLLLVLAVNWPLVLNLDSHVVGRPFDDAFEALWLLSAVHEAAFETHSNPFYTPNVFYPQGWYLASGAQPPWYYVLLAPLTAVAGPVITFNLALLATFVLGGFGVYLLAVNLTGKKVAAIIAGCAYIAAPIFTLRLGGHLNVLFGMMFLPYAAGAIGRALTRESAGRRWVLLAGALLAATILSHWYFLFIATLPLAGLALATPSAVAWRARLLRLLATGVVALILVAPFAFLTLQARQTMLPGGGTFPLANSERQGLSPDYLLAPNPLHPLWRERIKDIFPVTGEWDVVALGYAAVALALLGLATTPWRQTRPFVVMAVISFVLGLGPTLRWRGERVLLPAPSWVARLLSPLFHALTFPAGNIPVALPGLLFYYAVPFYDSVRVWARFAVPLTLAVAVLAGFGAAWLLGKGRAGTLAAAVLGGLIVFEGVISPYQHLTAVASNDRAVDVWLAAQPKGASLIEYPRPWVDKLAMFSQSRHGQRVVNGYMSFTPAFLVEAEAQLGEWPNPAALPILRAWDIEYVVVSGLPDVAVFRDEIWPAILAVDGLCLTASFSDAYGFMDFRETHVFALVEPGAACPARR